MGRFIKMNDELRGALGGIETILNMPRVDSGIREASCPNLQSPLLPCECDIPEKVSQN